MATQLSGSVQVAAQGLYTSSADQNHNLGDTVRSNDGRTFRYCKAGGSSLISAELQQAKAENTSDQNLAVAAAAIGDTTVTTTTTVTVDANEYANGFMVVAVTPGLGKIYKIKSHPAASGAVVTLTLSDPIEVALTSVSRVDLVANPYDSVIQQPTSRTSATLGVAVHPITNAQFGWLGVNGPQPVLADSAGLTVGLHFTSSDATAGATEVITDGNTELLPPIGRALSGVAAGEVGVGFLNLG